MSTAQGTAAAFVTVLLVMMATSCASPSGSSSHKTTTRVDAYPIHSDTIGRIGQGFELFANYQELDELEAQAASTNGSRTTIELKDEDRKRAGIRYTAGIESAKVYLQAFVEEFLGDSYDNVGAGGGLIAEPEIGRILGAAFLAVLRAEVNWVDGEDGTLRIVDPATGDVVGRSEEDFQYLDLNGEAGFALDWLGIRPGAGLALSSIDGEMDNPFGSDVDFDGTNVAGYLRVGFRRGDFPLVGEVSGYFGDIRGVAVTFGVQF